ncbi:MAG: methyltransferase domain-containing protein [Hyphomicrobiales bacterium]|nr:methyltransferase domain-containing protein [Hyphomicrobiales bacterium]
MSPPLIFDRALIRRRLSRAAQGRPAAFLIANVAEDLTERLKPILRGFPLAIDLGGATSHVAHALMQSGKIERVLRLSALPSPVRDGFPSAVVDEETLPLAEASVDLVVSLLSLQGVNDLPGALAQIRRGLRPDGLFIACLLGGETLTELRQSLAEAEAELSAGVSPRVAPFADARDLGALLQRAGFALPVTDVEKLTVRYANAFALMRDLRAMGMTNPLVERTRAPLRRAALLRAAQLYGERFTDPDGRLRATFDLVWLSGWAPHESQQRPLRPGSAKTRLAEALGVAEIKAGEKAKP